MNICCYFKNPDCSTLAKSSTNIFDLITEKNFSRYNYIAVNMNLNEISLNNECYRVGISAGGRPPPSQLKIYQLLPKPKTSRLLFLIKDRMRRR